MMDFTVVSSDLICCMFWTLKWRGGQNWSLPGDEWWRNPFVGSLTINSGTFWGMFGILTWKGGIANLLECGLCTNNFWKRGDWRVCSDYRVITLLILPGKVYSRVLERRLWPNRFWSYCAKPKSSWILSCSWVMGYWSERWTSWTALDLQVCLFSNYHLWSWPLCRDQTDKLMRFVCRAAGWGAHSEVARTRAAASRRWKEPIKGVRASGKDATSSLRCPGKVLG